MFPTGDWSNAMQRRPFRNVLSFPDQLSQEAERLRAEAERLPPGNERRELERKARQAETASYKDEWLNPPVFNHQNSAGEVRSVAEYLKMAAEFEALAAAAPVDVLRKRYDDVAARYRLLAKDPEHLIATGALQDDQPINVRPPTF
jgi:hypothetical protein